MRGFIIISFLSFFIPSIINAGEFSLPVPIVFLDVSNNAICSDTVQLLNRLLVEGKHVTEWLRPTNVREKHIAVNLKAIKYKKGLFSDTAKVRVDWIIKYTSNFEQKVESKIYYLKSGFIGTRINADHVMEATRDIVLRLKNDAISAEEYLTDD